MEIAAFHPQTVASWYLPMKEVRIVPLGDIQYGASGCDVERLKRHIAWGVQQQCYFIGMGDYMDVASPSNRRKWAEANLYDSVQDAMNQKIEDDLKKLQRILEPTKGRWLGLVTGHHVWDFQDGTTTDTRLAQFLGTRYMGDGAAVSILQFARDRPARDGPHRYLASAKIWYHHGRGSARNAGSALLTLQYAARSFYADVYLMGHRHVKEITKLPFIDYDVTAKGTIRPFCRNRVLATTGGFLQGYEVGRKDPMGRPSAGYVEKAMLPPVALGGTVIYIRPRILRGQVSLDIDASL